MTVHVMNTTAPKPSITEDHPVWAEIDLDQLRRNVQTVRAHIGHEKNITAVVKADGYGHGGVQIAKTLADEGVDSFAVASLQEGIELRLAGIKHDILVLSSVDPKHIYYFFDYNLVPSVFSTSFATKLQRVAEERRQLLTVHMRVDLASSGFGVFPDQAITFTHHLLTLDYLKLQGVYTHLVSAYGENRETVESDIEKFNAIVAKIREHVDIPDVHAASSPAMIRYPSSHYERVRVGTSLYGLPSFAEQELDVSPIMQLKACVQHIKTIPAGVSRGYSYQIKAKNDRRIAMIPLGYAHAFYLFFQKEGHVLINGKKVKLFGHSYMNHLLIDITDLDDVQIGDEVVLLGAQGRERITAAEVAQKSGIDVTNCESICLLGKNVPRLYV